MLPSEAETPAVLGGAQRGVFQGDGGLWGLLMPFDTSLRKQGQKAGIHQRLSDSELRPSESEPAVQLAGTCKGPLMMGRSGCEEQVNP